MAGGSRGIGQSLVNTGVRLGGNAPAGTAAQAGAAFTPVSPNVYDPAFSSAQQASVQQGISPLMQQLMQQRSAPYGSGLAGLYASLNSPVAQEVVKPTLMPAYNPSALAYRPNMAQMQANLGRVAISVAEQQRREAQAELDRLKEEQAKTSRTPTNTQIGGDYSGG